MERFTATRAAIQGLIERAADDTERMKWYQLEMVLVLAEATGRRLGSIRQLRWEDWDFERNTVRWCSQSDKKRREWLVPVPESLISEVKAYRVKVVTDTLRQGVTLSLLMFPDAPDSNRATDRHELRTWLEIAEKKAGLAKLDGALWHAYRRGWASSRKHMPVTDVAEVGGWKDIGTLLKCYTVADNHTMLEVMESPRKISDKAVSR